MTISKTKAAIGAIFIAFVFFCLGCFFSGGTQGTELVITAASSDAVRADTPMGGAAPAAEPGEQARSPESPAAQHRININTADAAELATLPGIGETLAQRIAEYRDTYGPFQSVVDLKKVEGIGEKRFAQIENLICVD